MWEEGEYSKIVLSTKVLFGRNISGYPFPNRFSSEQREEFRSFVAHHFPTLKNIRWSLWQKLPHQQKRLALERKMLSGQQALGEIGFLGMDSLENSYFFTEFYDHFDFIGLAGGWNWTSALIRARKIWRQIRPFYTWARHPLYGWIGPDPLFWGNGLRLTVTVHLPALEETGNIVQVFDLVEESRLSFRGLVSFDKRSLGDLYVIGTGPTTGKAMNEMLKELEEVLSMLTALEEKAQHSLWLNETVRIRDKVLRSYGILTHACLLPEEEAFECLSSLRLGVNLGIIKGVTLATINRLYYGILKGHLSFDLTGDDSPLEPEEELRAAFVKKVLMEGVDEDV